VRQFFELATKDAETGNYFVAFSADLVLTDVIIGPNSRAVPQEILEAMGPAGSDVEIITARLAFKSFSVVTNRSKINAHSPTWLRRSRA
jgi:hypothetical protein